MIDMVPKAITLTLVNHSKENLQRELLQELYKPDVLDELLKESEYVVSRRKEVVSMIQALNKAEEYVSPPHLSMRVRSPVFVSCAQDCGERVRTCVLSSAWTGVFVDGRFWCFCVAYAYSTIPLCILSRHIVDVCSIRTSLTVDCAHKAGLIGSACIPPLADDACRPVTSKLRIQPSHRPIAKHCSCY